MILTLREYRDTTSRLRPHFDAIVRTLDSAGPYTGKFGAKHIKFQAQRLIENLGFGAGLYDLAHLPPWRDALLSIEQVRAEWDRLLGMTFDTDRLEESINTFLRVRSKMEEIKEMARAFIRAEDEEEQVGKAYR